MIESELQLKQEDLFDHYNNQINFKNENFTKQQKLHLEEIIYSQQKLLRKNEQQLSNLESIRLARNNNIIKNLIKQFFNYLLKKKNQALVSEFIFSKPYPYCQKQIKKYFKQITYNNQSLVKLIKHEQYGKGLEYFLTFDAIEQLQISKVQNLEEHLRMIFLFKKYCANQDLLDDINFYKKKCK